MDFLGIHFVRPDYAWLLLPALLAAAILIVRKWALVARLKTLAHPQLRKQLFAGFSPVRSYIKPVLLACALFAFIIATMQPQWGKKEENIVQEGRDVLVLLDISRSMLAQDVKPNRLEFTKLKLKNLLSRFYAERVGLILFSGSAFVQCPLTVDRDAFSMFLNQVDVETIASGTTALDGALAKALQVFAQSKGRTNKLVLLATDGEDYSLNMSSIKRRAKKEGITLCALGIGTPQGAPIPIVNRKGKIVGHEKDARGAVAMTKLDEEKLQSMCTELNGKYIKATYSDSDINQILSFIRSFEKEKFADKKLSMYEDQYPWALAAAWMLLALEWIL